MPKPEETPHVRKLVEAQSAAFQAHLDAKQKLDAATEALDLARRTDEDLWECVDSPDERVSLRPVVEELIRRAVEEAAPNRGDLTRASKAPF